MAEITNLKELEKALRKAFWMGAEDYDDKTLKRKFPRTWEEWELQLEALAQFRTGLEEETLLLVTRYDVTAIDATEFRRKVLG